MENVFMTQDQLKAYLAENWQNAINYRVDNNPTDVYQLIKMNYGEEFQSLANGAETTEGSREMLLKFLVRKAQESGKPEAYSVWIWSAIPHNLNTNNWTNQIQ